MLTRSIFLYHTYRVQNHQKPNCVQYWILCCRPMVFIIWLLLIRLPSFLKAMISWLSRIIIAFNSHTIKKCFHGQNKYHRFTQNNWVGYQISTGGGVFWPKSVGFGGLLRRGGLKILWLLKYYWFLCICIGVKNRLWESEAFSNAFEIIGRNLHWRTYSHEGSMSHLILSNAWVILGSLLSPPDMLSQFYFKCFVLILKGSKNYFIFKIRYLFVIWKDTILHQRLPIPTLIMSNNLVKLAEFHSRRIRETNTDSYVFLYNLRMSFIISPNSLDL